MGSEETMAPDSMYPEEALERRVHMLETAMRQAIALFDGDPQLELREFKARQILQTALPAREAADRKKT